MVTRDFLDEVNEVIERGLPPREVRVTENRSVILQFTTGVPGWQVDREINNAVGKTAQLDADQVLVNTTAASIGPHLAGLNFPPGQTATTTIATLMKQEDVSLAVAQLLTSQFLPTDPEPNVLNVQQAVQAVAHQGVIVQL
jgi:hypothetical protein